MITVQKFLTYIRLYDDRKDVNFLTLKMNDSEQQQNLRVYQMECVQQGLPIVLICYIICGLVDLQMLFGGFLTQDIVAISNDLLVILILSLLCRCKSHMTIGVVDMASYIFICLRMTGLVVEIYFSQADQAEQNNTDDEKGTDILRIKSAGVAWNLLLTYIVYIVFLSSEWL